MIREGKRRGLIQSYSYSKSKNCLYKHKVNFKCNQFASLFTELPCFCIAFTFVSKRGAVNTKTLFAISLFLFAPSDSAILLFSDIIAKTVPKYHPSECELILVKINYHIFIILLINYHNKYSISSVVSVWCFCQGNIQYNPTCPVERVIIKRRDKNIKMPTHLRIIYMI